MDYLLQRGSTKRTPQNTPIPGSNQIKNEAGGYGYPLDNATRLRRWLILGSAGGTYYASQKDLTKENLDVLFYELQRNGPATVQLIGDILTGRRSVRPNQCLYALAAATVKGDKDSRYAAYGLVREISTFTQLAQFIGYREALGGGWGRSMKSAVQDWYTTKSVPWVATQIVKYRNREGWSQRDVLRLSHPSAPHMHPLFMLATKGCVPEGASVPSVVEGYLLAQEAKTEAQLAAIVAGHRLTWEMVPNEWLWKTPGLTEVLAQGMPPWALVRNLGNMTRSGYIAPMSDGAAYVAKRLTDPEVIARGGVHPINVFVALHTYTRGSGGRSDRSWRPVREVVDALNDAFYLSYGNTNPTGKRIVVGIDVSGSMHGHSVKELPGLTADMAATALALTVMNSEPRYAVVAFDTGAYRIPFSAKQRIADAMAITRSSLPHGGTDCAQPILWAAHNKVPVDLFVILTDEQSWYGSVHPTQALTSYNNRVGTDAKLLSVALTPTATSIIDGKCESKMATVVGFDANLPQIISEFAGE